MTKAGWNRKRRYLTLLVMGAFSLALHAERVATTPAPSGYVDDYADVLSASGRSDLEAQCRQLHNDTHAQVFVVTIHTLDGEPVEKFANELFAKWKIGEAKTDRGLLMLFAIDEHKRWVEVGYGLEGALNDAKVGDIGREMVPSLRSNDYDGAVRLGVAEVAKVIYADAGAAPPEIVTSPPPAVVHLAPATQLQDGWWIVVLFIVVIVFFLVFILRAIWRGTLVSSNSSGSYWNDSGSSSNDAGSSFSCSASSNDSGFSGGDGGSSGGGGAGGDW